MKDISTFDEHLDQRYGKSGTESRVHFEIKAKVFIGRGSAKYHGLESGEEPLT